MKLLNCRACDDIIALHFQDRTCLCGKSRGRYLSSNIRVVYSGPARIIGLKNPEYRVTEPGNDYTWFVIPEGHNIKKEK